MNAYGAWLSIGALGLSWVVAARGPFDPAQLDPETAQESPDDSQARRLQRAPARGQSPFGSPSQVEFDREAWRERLQSPDLDSRERSFDELLDLARGAAGTGTRAALEEWATGDDELAWTSRLALRELHRSRSRNLSGSPLFLDHAPFGFFDFRPHGGGGGSDLPALMEELRRHMEARRGRAPGAAPRIPGTPQAPGSGGQPRSESQSFQLESGPDGVRVHVEEEVDGDTETKTYEAETMEELLRLYPELRERLDAGGLPSTLDVEALFGNLRDRTQGGQPKFLMRGKPRPVPTDVLGVYLSPPIESEGDGEVDGVARGVLVDRIAPGTIAEALGLRRGDLLLELNDVSLESAEDVSRALAEREDGQDVRVTYIDRRGNRRTMTWKASQ